MRMLAAGRPNLDSCRSKRTVWVRCANCGTNVLIYRSKLERTSRQYCGQKCQKEHRKGSNNPNWKGGRSTKRCATCRKEFTVRYHTKREQRRENLYCSAGCRHEGIRIYASLIEGHREQNRRREARERASKRLNGHHTLEEWKVLCKQHRHRCAHCKKKRRLCRDHIIPITKGGHDLISNIQPLCRPCNSRKGNRL